MNAVVEADALLLRRHQRGDKAAFSELFSRFRSPVAGYLFRAGVAPSAREDVLQEIFVKVHQGLAGYRGDGSLRGWVFTIVANTVRNYFRDRKQLEQEALDEIADSGVTAEELLQASETAAFVDREIRRLPLVQREVLTLSCAEHMEQDEVAKILSIPVNTVKTHLRRARITLADALARRSRR